MVDTYRSFSLTPQAIEDFKTLASRKSGDENATNDVVIIKIETEHSQVSMDTLVKSIYQREILITQENVVEILLLANYLQLSFLPASPSSNNIALIRPRPSS